MTKAQIIQISLIRTKYEEQGNKKKSFVVAELPENEVIVSINSPERYETYIIAYDGCIVEGNIREHIAQQPRSPIVEQVELLENFYKLTNTPYEIELTPNHKGVMVKTERLINVFWHDGEHVQYGANDRS